MSGKSLIYLLLLLLSQSMAYSQEIVTGLYRNIYLNRGKESVNSSKGINQPDTLELPFSDDFSDSYIFPDPERWEERDVFINNTWSINQITVGMATFDALDYNGNLYETASQFVFEADHLTSKPINLQYPSSDNVYLSFFYEAAGIGDPPESNDSLVLHFWAPMEEKWYSVWKTSPADTTGFKPLIIKIEDNKFLQKGFRFRFINYASLTGTTTDPSMAGNCDQWNIDYIILDKNRNPNDTILHDVAFTLPVRSVLKTYEQMPWKQFRQVFLSEMSPYITVNYRNNDTIIRNITRNFRITDVYKDSITLFFTAGAVNINPLEPVKYDAELIYTFNSSYTDSALFRIECMLITDAFDRKQNDTIVYYQRFGRCFAYDDGTAEAGYGINGQGSRNAMVAYLFKSFIPDSLRAVQICFNDSYQNANRRSFDLMVWNNYKGIPGDVICSKEELLVKPGEGINGFYTYELDTPVEINGEFFVGWRQRSETFLNAGFDLNTPHKSRQLYFLGGEWNVSQMPGSVMIRPIFGPPIKSTGIKTVTENNNTIRLWPNPASEYVNITSNDPLLILNATIFITDISGRTLKKIRNQERIDISDLPAGIYLVTVHSGNRHVVTTRLIVTR